MKKKSYVIRNRIKRSSRIVTGTVSSRLDISRGKHIGHLNSFETSSKAALAIPPEQKRRRPRSSLHHGSFCRKADVAKATFLRRVSAVSSFINLRASRACASTAPIREHVRLPDARDKRETLINIFVLKQSKY